MQYLVFVLVFAFYADSVSIPSYVNLCKRNDPNLSKCIIKTFNEIRPYLKKGIPEMNIPPGDPMYYHDLSASTGETKSLHFKAKTWKQVATGLMDVTIKNVIVDFNKPSFAANLLFPFVTLAGDYNIDGKVLLFEINSTGKFVLNNTNLEADTELIGKYIEKDGKKYIEFVNINLLLNLDKTSIYFTNLIPANEVLSTTLNKVINDNINILYEDLAPVVHDVFGGLTLQYFNEIFTVLPINEIFPED